MCSSPQGCHPGDIAFRKCSSSRGHCPGDVLLVPGTLSLGCAPHPGDIIPGIHSSSQPHHPGEVLLTLRTSPCGCPQAPACCHLTLVPPLAGAGAGAGGEALQGGERPARQRPQADQQPPQHRAQAVALPVPPAHLAPLRLGRPVSPQLVPREGWHSQGSPGCLTPRCPPGTRRRFAGSCQVLRPTPG